MRDEFLPSRLCEYTVTGFALWTLTCHLTVFTKGGLLRLICSFAGVCLLLLFWQWKRQRFPPLRGSIPTPLREHHLRHSQQLQQILLWVLVCMAVVLTMIAHRSDADDNRYINWAIAAVDDPFLPILQYDTLHSPPTRPIFPQATKVMSREMLAAALSWLTGIPPTYFLHLVFAPLAAMFAILAYGELFKILAPKHWFYGVLGSWVFLIANGNVHRTYGNFSFVRLHQGKGVLVTVMVPLIIAYGLRFVANPSFRSGLLFGAAQVASIGMTSTALMVTPVVAFFSILTGLPGTDRFTKQTKHIMAGLVIVAVIAALGLLLNLSSHLLTPYSLGMSSTEFLDQQIKLIFGNGQFAYVCLFIVLTAWFWCDTRVARYLCLVFPILFVLIFANPLTAGIIARYITKSIYWRVFWILPLPTMAGLTLLAPFTCHKFPSNPTIRYGLYGGLLVLMFGVFSEQHILAPKNHLRIGMPGLKVPPEYEIAKAINTLVEGRPNVLVPETVSTWLPTMSQHPYPLVSRLIHTASFTKQERRERVGLKLYIMGDARLQRYQRFIDIPQLFSEGIQKYQIAAVCVLPSNLWIEDIHQVLQKSGFTLHQTLLSHEIWLKEQKI